MISAHYQHLSHESRDDTGLDKWLPLKDLLEAPWLVHVGDLAVRWIIAPRLHVSTRQ